MAARTEYTGTLSIGLFTLPLQGVKATKKYAGNEPISDVCACHEQPIDKRHRCVVSGDLSPATIKAAKREDGSVAILSEADLASIEAATESGTMDLLDVLPRTEALARPTADLFYLRLPAKEAKGREQHFSLLKEWLRTKDTAIVARIVRRAREKRVVIYVDGEKLCMAPLLYAQELHAPEPDVLLHTEVPPAMLAQFDTIMQSLELPGLDLDNEADAAITRKQEVVAKALAGEAVAPTEVAATEAPPAVDLMASLSAEVARIEAQRGGKKPARKPTKAKVKA